MFALYCQLGADIADIVGDSPHCAGIERNDALFIFGIAANKTGSQIDVLHIQRDQFADPNACRIEELQHGVVTVALLIHALGLRQQ